MGSLSVESYAIIAAIAAAGGFLLIFTGIYAASYERKKKRKRGSRRAPADDWLFTGFADRLYVLFFRDRDPVEIVSKFGIKAEEHAANCRLAGIKADFMKMAMVRVLGIALLVAFCFLGFATGAIWLVLAGLGPFCLCLMYDRLHAENLAKRKKARIADELPRFMELLQTELASGIAIETAIKILCEHMDTLLAREMREAFGKVELGAGDWKEMLKEVANKYDVDSLNSFALTVTTAYEKGVSVAVTVERETEEIRESYILSKKETAGKMQNSVLLPIMIFQIVPLMIFFLYPSFVSIMGDW